MELCDNRYGDTLMPSVLLLPPELHDYTNKYSVTSGTLSNNKILDLPKKKAGGNLSVDEIIRFLFRKHVLQTQSATKIQLNKWMAEIYG